MPFPLWFIYASALTGPNPNQNFGSIEELAVILILISLVVVRRIVRGVYGRRYSTGRVLFLPAFYIFLTLVFVIFLNLGDSYIYYTLLLIPAGALAGLRVGGGATFFMKNGEVYYKRSPFILIFWLISYIARLLLDFYFPTNVTVAFAIDVVLALTAGLIVGEAIHLIKGRKDFKPQAQSEEGFVINQ